MTMAERISELCRELDIITVRQQYKIGIAICAEVGVVKHGGRGKRDIEIGAVCEGLSKAIPGRSASWFRSCFCLARGLKAEQFEALVARNTPIRIMLRLAAHPSEVRDYLASGVKGVGRGKHKRGGGRPLGSVNEVDHGSSNPMENPIEVPRTWPGRERAADIMAEVLASWRSYLPDVVELWPACVDRARKI